MAVMRLQHVARSQPSLPHPMQATTEERLHWGPLLGLCIKNCSSGQQDDYLQLTTSLLSRHVSVHFSAQGSQLHRWRNSGGSTTTAPAKEESVLSRSSAFSSSMVRCRSTEHSSLPRHLLGTYVWCHLFAQLLYAPSGWNNTLPPAASAWTCFFNTHS